MTAYLDSITRVDATFREFVLEYAYALRLARSINNAPEAPDLDAQYEKNVAYARVHLDRLRAMTPEQRLGSYEAACRGIEMYKRNVAEGAVDLPIRLARYDRMKALVEAWTPPASTYGTLLKEHMLSRLATLSRADATLASAAGASAATPPIPPPNAEAHYQSLVDHAEKHVAESETALQAAIRWHQGQIAFVKALHESLSEGPVTAATELAKQSAE